jgi:hypothetical protein
VRAGYDERGRDFIALDADPERPQRSARHDGPRKATPEQSQRLFAIDRYANQDEIGLIENYKTNPIFLRDCVVTPAGGQCCGGFARVGELLARGWSQFSPVEIATVEKYNIY